MRWLLCLRPSRASPGLATARTSAHFLWHARPSVIQGQTAVLVLSPIYSLVTFFHDCVSLPLSFALPGLLSTFWWIPSSVPETSLLWIFNPVRSSDHSFCGTLHTWIHCTDPQSHLLNPYDQMYFRNKKVQNLEKWCRAFTTDYVTTPKGHIYSLLSIQVRYEC